VNNNHDLTTLEAKIYSFIFHLFQTFISINYYFAILQNVSSPEHMSSSPGGGFSPSKKLHFTSSLNNLLQSPHSLLVDEEPDIDQPPLPSQPTIDSGRSVGLASSGLVQSPEPKVCIVTPRREVAFQSQVSSAPSGKFMTVFENMLTSNLSTWQHKSDGNLGIDADEVGGAIINVEEVGGAVSSTTSVESSRSYKPGRSAASAFRSSPPKHEYAQIVNKLTHRHDVGKQQGSSSLDDIVKSNSTTTHTAFRLVNQGDAGVPPKLQKYLVETQVSTVSTLISENDEVPLPINSGDLAGTKTRDSSRPTTTPESIFKKLGALNMKEDRAEFV